MDPELELRASGHAWRRRSPTRIGRAGKAQSRRSAAQRGVATDEFERYSLQLAAERLLASARSILMDSGEKKALADIEKFGCHIIHVIGEGESPPFSYSVGITRASGRLMPPKWWSSDSSERSPTLS